MSETKTCESFPLGIVLLANLVALAIYALGAYIMAGFGILWAILYLLYCLWTEIEVLRGSCAHCYYYGKLCGLGKGKLCSLLFPRGDPQKFAQREISLTNILPDLMVFIFPIVGGIALLLINFSWLLAASLAVLAILAFFGNAAVRGSFACKYCKQREIGCPAEKMFRKETAD